MSAVHFVSATAPSDQCKAAKAAKLLTSTLARTCGDEMQRIANWQCMEHGLEGAIVMRFIDTNAVTKATEWVSDIPNTTQRLKIKDLHWMPGLAGKGQKRLCVKQMHGGFVSWAYCSRLV